MIYGLVDAAEEISSSLLKPPRYLKGSVLQSVGGQTLVAGQ